MGCRISSKVKLCTGNDHNFSNAFFLIWEALLFEQIWKVQDRGFITSYALAQLSLVTMWWLASDSGVGQMGCFLGCEQSLFFLRFSDGSARARASASAERWSRETRETRAPSVTRVVICVSCAFCLMDQEKRETARSLVVFGHDAFQLWADSGLSLLHKSDLL